MTSKKSDHFDKSDPHSADDDAWKNLAAGEPAFYRGAHIGEVVYAESYLHHIFVRMNPPQSTELTKISPCVKESFLLHSDEVLVGGNSIHRFDYQQRIGMFNLKSPRGNYSRRTRPNPSGTCVLLNDIGKMLFNNNHEAEKESLARGCEVIAGAFDQLMSTIQKTPEMAKKFRTHLFREFTVSEGFDIQFEHQFTDADYVYGTHLSDAVEKCIDRFAAVGPTFANIHFAEFTLLFHRDTFFEGHEEVNVSFPKTQISGDLNDLQPWKVGTSHLPTTSPLRLVGCRLCLQRTISGH